MKKNPFKVNGDYKKSMVNNYKAEVDFNKINIRSDTKKFIKILIEREPELRPSVEEALESSVFAQLDSCMDNTIEEDINKFNTSYLFIILEILKQKQSWI